jgi:hypothetical protein
MNFKSEEFINNLPQWAEEYIKVCLNHSKEVATGSGKIVNQKERHIPTIAFFLNIWLPFNKGDSINRKTYYEWLNSSNELRSNTIKSIDELFKSLAVDIVANEGKGIFYAKNKLGMTDRVESKNENINKNIQVEVIKSDAPIANNEKDITLD